MSASLRPIQTSLGLAAVDSAAKVVALGVPDLRYEHSPTILTTDALGFAVAVGVYDPGSQNGLLAVSPYFDDNHFDHFRGAVKGLFDVSSPLVVNVLGGAVLSPSCKTRSSRDRDRRFIIAERLRLEYSLRKLFGHQPIQYNWLPPGHCGRLFLYTMTGEFKHHIWPESEPEPASDL